MLFSLHPNGADVVPSILAVLGAMSEDCMITTTPAVEGDTKKSASGTVPGTSKSKKQKEKVESRQRTKRSSKLSVSELITRPMLTQFIQIHLLESSDGATRKHAQSFLFWLWRAALKSYDQSMMMTLVSEWIPFVPLFGRHAKEYIEFVVTILAESG
jgi:hypothetical protein